MAGLTDEQKQGIYEQTQFFKEKIEKDQLEPRDLLLQFSSLRLWSFLASEQAKHPTSDLRRQLRAETELTCIQQCLSARTATAQLQLPQTLTADLPPVDQVVASSLRLPMKPRPPPTPVLPPVKPAATHPPIFDRLEHPPPPSSFSSSSFSAPPPPRSGSFPSASTRGRRGSGPYSPAMQIWSSLTSSPSSPSPSSSSSRGQASSDSESSSSSSSSYHNSNGRSSLRPSQPTYSSSSSSYSSPSISSPSSMVVEPPTSAATSRFAKRPKQIAYSAAQITEPQQDDDSKRAQNGGGSSFRSAFDKLRSDRREKGAPDRPRQESSGGGSGGGAGGGAGASNGRRFQPPFKREPSDSEPATKKPRGTGEDEERNPILDDERLAGLEEQLVTRILIDVMVKHLHVEWEDIAGLDAAKKIIQEVVVLPLLRPDIFCGLREPPKGVLLFGPPGTGKTMIGKAIASQSGSTFFNISASSLTSKWVGESEKMVRALFAVARVLQPSVIFIDEIDSMLCSRSESDVESSRRLKTEFLVQMDGAGNAGNDRVFVIGATNRPQELDDAVRRRLIRRLYIPLPDAKARRYLIKHKLRNQTHELSDEDVERVVEQSKGYSAADIGSLCSEASMGPVRDLSLAELGTISREAVRAMRTRDFTSALKAVRPSVALSDLKQFVVWNDQYGGGLSEITELD